MNAGTSTKERIADLRAQLDQAVTSEAVARISRELDEAQAMLAAEERAAANRARMDEVVTLGDGQRELERRERTAEAVRDQRRATYDAIAAGVVIGLSRRTLREACDRGAPYPALSSVSYAVAEATREAERSGTCDPMQIAKRLALAVEAPAEAKAAE